MAVPAVTFETFGGPGIGVAADFDRAIAGVGIAAFGVDVGPAVADLVEAFALAAVVTDTEMAGFGGTCSAFALAAFSAATFFALASLAALEAAAAASLRILAALTSAIFRSFSIKSGA